MTKEFKNIELDDLCGEVKKIEAKSKKNVAPPSDPNALNVLIPYENSRYKAVDLFTCSAEDFVDWVASVYPLDIELEPLIYRNVNNRVTKYKHIIQFYSFNLFSVKNPVKDLAYC